MTTATLARRGTSNSNDRGSAEQRRRRKAWLIEVYRSDLVALRTTWGDGVVETRFYKPETAAALLGLRLGFQSEILPACRCYCCGQLLIAETVTVDRIIPGCQGGTYARNNIRPACAFCNSSTGGKTRRKK